MGPGGRSASPVPGDAVINFWPECLSCAGD
jgi:hypothetical protein